MVRRPAFQARGSGFDSAGSSAFGNFDSSAGSLSYLAKPVDTSSISDASVIVNFKSLQKKDETTKAKALEDLIAYTRQHPFELDGGVENSVLDAWVSFYPRISIDNSRRVRELAHLLQSALLESTRKRMEKRLLEIFAVWYAGRFDSSTPVARAVATGQSAFITSREKNAFFLSRCQAQILRFSIDALKETVDTLSDERSTTPEDAEAKYYRVVNAALMLVNSLLQTVPNDARDKHAELYEEFFANEKIWDSFNVSDGQVSRAICDLFVLSIGQYPEHIRAQKSRLKKALINEGLKADHPGSNIKFTKTLAVFSTTFPEIWSPSPKDRKTPLSRLRPFLEKGSQNSGAEFWVSLAQLFDTIPDKEISLVDSIKVMDAMRVGMANRADKLAAGNAWDSYCKIAIKMLGALETEEILEFATKALLPAFETALGPTIEPSNWVIETSPYRFLSAIFYALMLGSSDDARKALDETLSKISAALCAAISSSLPAVSRDYVESQETVSVQGRRWFSFVGMLQADSRYKTVPHDAIDNVSLEILQKCIYVLDARNFNPFGAAQVLRHGLEQTAVTETEIPGLVDFLIKAGTKSIETVLKSRCRAEIVAMVKSVGEADSAMASSYVSIWGTWITSLLAVSSQELKEDKFDTICGLSCYKPGMDLALVNTELQAAIVDRCMETALSGDVPDVSQLKLLLESNIMEPETVYSTVKNIVRLLADYPQDVDRILGVYEVVAAQKKFILTDPDLGLAFNTQLLSLAEGADEDISLKSMSLHGKVFANLDDEWEARIIQHSLSAAKPRSLGIKSMIKISEDKIKNNASFIKDILPSTSIWMSEIQKFVNNVGLDPMLAVTNPMALASAQFLVDAGLGQVLELQRDKLGRSIPVRMAMFLQSLYKTEPGSFLHIEDNVLATAVFCLVLTNQVAWDQLSLAESDQLFMESDKQLDSFITTSEDVAKEILKDVFAPSAVQLLVSQCLDRITGFTPYDFYLARTLHQCLQWLDDAVDIGYIHEIMAARNLLKPNLSNVLSILAIVGGCRDHLSGSKQMEIMLNRLVSEVQGQKLGSPNVIATLCPLTALLHVFDFGKAPVPPNRVTFAIRQLTTWLDGQPNDGELGEIFRVLSQLLPNILEMYGTHWQDTLNAVVNLWNRRSSEFMDAMWPVYTSLRLYSILQDIAEPNDDLEDALKEAAPMKHRGILRLLKAEREVDCHPLQLVDDLIGRFADKIPATDISDYQDLVVLLGSPFRSVHNTAFNLLFRVLPSVQEQTNTDFIIDKKVPTLPSELIEILDRKPVYEELTDDEISGFPAFIRGYLYGWMVTFEMYRLAQFDVRDLYTTQLQEAKLFGPLFEFTFNMLGHVDGDALNLESRKITSSLIMTYNVMAGTLEEDHFVMQWLLTHVYFLCLKYVPGVFRKWYMDVTSKQTKLAIESWTGKYISPLIVDTLLDEVKTWSEAQDASGDDEQKLNIKISRNTKEVSAGYEIDETEATISIKIPKSYPLGNVDVVGTNRVGVNEKKWQSWVRSTQGVITFSNGSIIDGLVAFKRNMVGAMKGQSECAICYAIISADKRMPDKRCGTCKHYFHKTCLYKWFQTSSQNSCPLCRNPIDYLGADSQVRRGGREE